MIMIKTVTYAKELAGKFNALKTDLERLAFLKAHKGELKVVLDNDCTMVEFDIDPILSEEEADLITDRRLNSFDDYHGWTDAVVELFEFAGITAETC